MDLPKPIAAYFTADKGGGQAFVSCFSDDAIVKDEGLTYDGLAEIERWKAQSSSKYTYTSEPFALAMDDGKTVVTSRLVGNFPGSPTDLRYFFVYDRGKITSLEIIP